MKRFRYCFVTRLEDEEEGLQKWNLKEAKTESMKMAEQVPFWLVWILWNNTPTLPNQDLYRQRFCGQDHSKRRKS